MIKKTFSNHKLIIFWIIAIPLLIAWYMFLQWNNNPKEMAEVAYNTSRVLPLGEKYDVALEIGHYLLQKGNKERTFLILLQNNMELRPGGGYIGSFAIVKIKNGDVIDVAVHDTSNFDGRIPDTVEPPFPIEETMGISSWKLRDSNWMSDFPTNARLAEKFYKLGGGEEKFDGVIAVNASILDAILEITGPIQISGYPDIYKSGDAIVKLEYQVEKGYKEQGIKKGDRKVVMDKLAKEISNRIKSLSLQQKLALAKQMKYVMDNKDVQLYFKDSVMQELVEAVGWSGSIDTEWDKDYLNVVDANLASYKTDYYIERSIDYDVDLTGTVPQVVLTLHYANTAQQKDWMTNDYQTYVRVYIPNNSWVTSAQPCVLPPKYGNKYGKKYIGCLVHVPIGTSKDIVFRYNLPLDVKNNYPYDLKIQKQSGVHNIPVQVHIQETGEDDMKTEYKFVLNKDVILSKLGK